MNTTNNFTLPALEAGITKGRASGKTGQGPFHYGPVSRKFIASQEPPAKKKFKAPKAFLPPAEVDPAAGGDRDRVALLQHDVGAAEDMAR